MSLIFDTNKRKISLGGKSKATESREEFLRKSQAERERRAQERKELKSAKHIQASDIEVIQATFYVQGS